MNIIVLNLPRTTTKEELNTLFTAHGSVASCEIVMDSETGSSKGFGFVDMKDAAESKSAIDALHGTKIGNRKIRVKASTKKEGNKRHS